MNRMFAEDVPGEGEAPDGALQQPGGFDDIDEEEDDFIVNDEEGEEGEPMRPRPKVVKKARAMPAGIDNE